MKNHIVLVSLGLSIFYLSGCTPAGKSYWLTYKADPKVAPASIYSGYYENEPDDLIVACLGLEEQEPKEPIKRSDESKAAYDERKAQYNKLYAEWKPRHDQYEQDQNKRRCPNRNKMTKPSLLDRDQAKIAAFKTAPDDADLNRMECQITPTKITRPAITIYEQLKISFGPGAISNPSVYSCDLHVADAGGMRLDYVIRPHAGSGGQESNTNKSMPGTALVNDSIEVHTLYRFRVLVGPVYSTLSDKDLRFTAKSHTGGDSFVASDVKGNPVSAAVFLKYYLQPRDVYDTSFCLKTKSEKKGEEVVEKLDWKETVYACLGRINPMIGVNVSNDPLKNVYVGGGIDILPGLDIVGGVHWSAIDTLSGGFVSGQVVPNNTAIPTETKLLQGWFAGIMLDVGVAGSWLGKSTTGIFK